MKRLTAFSVLSAVLFIGSPVPGQATVEGESATSPDSPASNEDEAAIRSAIDSYVAAFNRGDPEALAGHWTENGQFVTPSGELLQGRLQLRESFAAYFRDTPGAKIEVLDPAVEFLSPNVAIENGIARVIRAEQQPTETLYEAIHVKTTEGWKMDSVREQDPPSTPPSHHDQLKDLEWMIGTWVDSDENAAIETSCRWTTNQNFLVRSFKLFVEDRVDFEGTQVIGWDPYSGAIRSWVFDSDGGFGVGRWSRGEGRWTVHTLNVLPDGRRGSSTNIYELVNGDTVRFSSVGRQVDGELLPNIDPVTVVRAQEQ